MSEQKPGRTCPNCGQEIASPKVASCPNCGGNLPRVKTRNGVSRSVAWLGLVALVGALALGVLGFGAWFVVNSITSPLSEEPPKTAENSSFKTGDERPTKHKATEARTTPPSTSPPPLPPPPPPRRSEPPARPGESQKQLSKGERLMSRGEKRAARDAFAEATRLDPKNAFAWANLGSAEMVLGDAGAAKKAYDRALTVDGGNWLAHYNLASYYARQESRNQTFQHLEQCLGALRQQGAQRELSAVLDDLKKNPLFTQVRHDPSFRDLLTSL